MSSAISAQITKNEILSLLKSYLLAPLFIKVCQYLLLRWHHPFDIFVSKLWFFNERFNLCRYYGNSSSAEIKTGLEKQFKEPFSCQSEA